MRRQSCTALWAVCKLARSLCVMRSARTRSCVGVFSFWYCHCFSARACRNRNSQSHTLRMSRRFCNRSATGQHKIPAGFGDDLGLCCSKHCRVQLAGISNHSISTQDSRPSAEAYPLPRMNRAASHVEILDPMAAVNNSSRTHKTSCHHGVHIFSM